jgi:thymidylate synthase, flavin-dependent
VLVAFAVIDADACMGEFPLQDVGAVFRAIHPALDGDQRGVAVAVQHEDILAAGAPFDAESVQSLVYIAQTRVAMVKEVAFRHVFAVVAGGVGDALMPSQRRQFGACALFINQAMHLLLYLAQVAFGRLARLPSCALLWHTLRIPCRNSRADTKQFPAMAKRGVMEVSLIFPEAETIRKYYRGLVYLAARTCYSEKTPQQIWDEFVADKTPPERVMKLMEHVIESGHHSTIEHISFTFAISGVSRALSHQLVRHRIGVAFDQQSQRYVKYKEPQYVTPPSIEANPDALQEFERFRDVSEEIYHRFLAQGIPAEDARFIFPNAVATNLIMTVNLRQLMHMAGLRLCTLAQWEIRQLFKLIRKEVMAADSYFGRLLVPKCVPLGYCDEKRNEDEHCRIRPHKNSVFRVWELYKRGALVERENA